MLTHCLTAASARAVLAPAWLPGSSSPPVPRSRDFFACLNRTPRTMNRAGRPFSRSSPQYGQDCLHLFPNGSAQPVGGLVDLGPVFLADIGESRLLVSGQVQVLE